MIKTAFVLMIAFSALTITSCSKTNYKMCCYISKCSCTCCEECKCIKK